jgi:hypothetical protein
MRLELQRIPQDAKRALVEAQHKCGEDEFSNGTFPLMKGHEYEGSSKDEPYMCAITPLSNTIGSHILYLSL